MQTTKTLIRLSMHRLIWVLVGCICQKAHIRDNGLAHFVVPSSLFFFSLYSSIKKLSSWDTVLTVTLKPFRWSSCHMPPVTERSPPKLASVAQLDAPLDWRPGGRGFNPRQGWQHSLWRLIMKYILRSFSPFRWFKKGSCQFLAKECAQYWLTA